MSVEAASIGVAALSWSVWFSRNSAVGALLMIRLGNQITLGALHAFGGRMRNCARRARR